MKPPGSLVSLYYDGRTLVDEGDYIQTRTGRTYLIQSVRVQARGKHVGRQHLKCVVMAPEHEIEEDAVVHPIYWYAR